MFLNNNGCLIKITGEKRKYMYIYIYIYILYTKNDLKNCLKSVLFWKTPQKKNAV